MMMQFRTVFPERREGRLGLLGELMSDLRTFIGSDSKKLGTLMVLGAALEGIGLLLLIPILSVTLDTGGENQWLLALGQWLQQVAPTSSRFDKLVSLLMLFGVVLVIRAKVILSRDVMLAQVQAGFVQSHRLEIVRLLSSGEWRAITRLRHGRVTHVLGLDVQACGDAVSFLLSSTVAATLLVGHCILAFFISPYLTLFAFVLLVAGALTLHPTVRRSRELGASLTETNLKLVTTTNNLLGGLKLALSQNLQRGFLRELKLMLNEAAARRVAFARQRTGTQLWLTAAAAAIGSATILLGVGVLDASPANILAFLFILARMNGPATQLQASAQQIFHSLPAYQKIKDLEHELGQAQCGAVASPLGEPPRLKGEIAFKKVSFWHDAGTEGSVGRGGIYDLDLAIAEGDLLGVSGPSGAGKTTFVDLLVGLYAPRGGTISVGGTILEGEALHAWRDQISYVSQDPFLFHDTIRENLRWAKEDAAEAELWDALARAGAHDLVHRLGDQLDTVVGERGTLLSGGERQRIALARALLRKPRLLVLDEATNAIDIAGERAVLDGLRNDAFRPTIVMVAHRESSLAFCESRIEFENGRLVRGG
jgi:ATP-binding cassette subfamily C protein